MLGRLQRGAVTNQAAVELTQEGFGKMFCLAGIGGQLSGFVQSARDVPVMVAVDGCPVGCAKAILENAQVPLKHYLMITEEGIEKNKNFNLEQVKSAIRRMVSENGPVEAVPTTGGCSCTKC